jgi:hypothetical protein
VAGEVATGQLCQGAVAIHGPGRAQPVVDERIAVLAADHRSADGDATEAGADEQVHQCLSGGGHARGGDALTELRAGEWALVGQRALDRVHAALGGLRRDALLGQTPSVRGEQRWCGQRLQPRVVLAADEMQRAAAEPGDQQ